MVVGLFFQQAIFSFLPLSKSIRIPNVCHVPQGAISSIVVLKGIIFAQKGFMWLAIEWQKLVDYLDQYGYIANLRTYGKLLESKTKSTLS